MRVLISIERLASLDIIMMSLCAHCSLSSAWQLFIHVLSIGAYPFQNDTMELRVSSERRREGGRERKLGMLCEAKCPNYWLSGHIQL